jgi:hypothetical protein
MGLYETMKAKQCILLSILFVRCASAYTLDSLSSQAAKEESNSSRPSLMLLYNGIVSLTGLNVTITLQRPDLLVGTIG